MKVLIFGATGMVGRGALLECLRDPEVQLVVSLGRSSAGIRDPKLQEILHRDLLNYAGMEESLAGFDACFFCLGVASAGMKEADYERITYGYTVAVAELLSCINPGMAFVFVSGSGTDSSEKGRVMWARVKGRTENTLLKLPLQAICSAPASLSRWTAFSPRRHCISDYMQCSDRYSPYSAVHSPTRSCQQGRSVEPCSM